MKELWPCDFPTKETTKSKIYIQNNNWVPTMWIWHAFGEFRFLEALLWTHWDHSRSSGRPATGFPFIGIIFSFFPEIKSGQRKLWWIVNSWTNTKVTKSPCDQDETFLIVESSSFGGWYSNLPTTHFLFLCVLRIRLLQFNSNYQMNL